MTPAVCPFSVVKSLKCQQTAFLSVNKTSCVVLGLSFRLLDRSVSKEEIIVVLLMQISKILKLFFNSPNFYQQKVIQLKLVIFGLLVVSSERQIFNGSFTKNFGVC